MKVTFIYPDILEAGPTWGGCFYQGVGLLSSVLKKMNHNTSLIHITKRINKTEFIEAVYQRASDLIAFSSTTIMFPYIKEWAGWLAEERLGIPVICGGIHPTIYPEHAISVKGIDMICIGEGEESIAELCNKMAKGEDYRAIDNIWIKEKDKIYKNGIRRLISDLNDIPFADRGIFDYKNMCMEKEGRAQILASRGCPFNCSYCCHHVLRKIYKGKGKYVRFRTINNVVNEIQEIIKLYAFINSIFFADDLIWLNKKWAKALFKEYKQRIGLPFSCNGRADLIDQDMASALKEAGCDEVHIGVESGNDYIRNEILQRNQSQGQIINAFSICRKVGIKILYSFNMVGMPLKI